MKRQQFVVIGLGRFGRSVCRNLYVQGHEVLAVDVSAEEVRQAAAEEIATHVVQADSTDPRALQELGIQEFDAVVVAIGTDLEASVLIVLNLIDLGVKRIVAKASYDRYGKVLERLGGSAIQVVYPEAQMGERVANALTGITILESIELDPNTTIVELPTPQAFVGKHLEELDLPRRHGVILVAIKRGERVLLAHLDTERVEAGDVLALIGPNDRLRALPR
ncbi:MAG TPA: TrkA family potassium uptake protein [Stenomitos sp.]